MRVKLEIATPAGAPDVVLLRNATSEGLTAEYGRGEWSWGTTEKGLLLCGQVSQPVDRYVRALHAKTWGDR